MQIERTTLITALSLVFFATALSAESVRVYEDYPGNLFYAPYEAIPDHPECNAPDQIAFRTTLSADDIGFRIYDVRARPENYREEPLDHLDINQGDVEVFQRETTCYVRQRSAAGEWLRAEIPCRDTSEPSPADTWRTIGKEGASLAIEGNVTACLSLDGLTVLESEWQTTVEIGDTSQRHTGEFSETQKDWTFHQEPPFILRSPRDRSTPIKHWATLTYNLSARAGYRQTWRNRFKLPSGYDAAQMRVTLSCIPIALAEVPDADLYLDAIVFFNLRKGAFQTCAGDACTGLQPPIAQTERGFTYRCLSKD